MRCAIHDCEFVDVLPLRRRRPSARPRLKAVMACPACVAEIRAKVRLERERCFYWFGRRVKPSLWAGLRESPR